jgi:hypothetical protein
MEPKRLRSPPYNTAVRDLVQGKRAWSPALAKKGVAHVTSGAGTLRQCWQQGYWDTYMRDAEHESRTRRYIENNPAKAKMVSFSKAWPWSSSRFRDAYERLCLPAR